MGSSDNTKLALGVFAATGVVLVSFFLLKKFNSQSTGKNKSKKGSPTQNIEETPSQSQGENVQQKKLNTSSTETSGDTVPVKEDFPSGPGLEGDTQTSYIFVSSQNEGLENDGKKSNGRSSDESSYDVIDDEEKERMEKDVDEIQPSEERLKDAQEETSIVILGDLDKSALEMSSSSVYASADETASDSPKPDATHMPSNDGGGDENTNNAREEEEDSGDRTMIKRGEGKSESSGNEDMSSKSKEEVSLEESTEDSSFMSVGTDDSETASNIVDLSGPDNAMKSDDLSEKESTEIIPVSQSVLDPGAQEDKPEDSSKKLEGELESTAELQADKIAEVLSSVSSSPADVTLDQLKVMVAVLYRNNLPPVQTLALDTLVKVTSFSQNNPKLHSAGIPAAIETLTLAKFEAVIDQEASEDVKIMTTLCQVITNLTLDPQNCHALENILPALVDLALKDEVPESLHRSLFPPIINFSSDPNFQPPLTKLIQRLFELLDHSPPDSQIQCLRVLVNLSLNSQMVPNILAAKSPECLQELLKESTNPDLILRTLTLLLNLESTMSAGHVTSASLPVEDKAESPHTLHSALTGVVSLPDLRNKVFALTQHTEQDIRTVAGKLHQIISSQKSE